MKISTSDFKTTVDFKTIFNFLLLLIAATMIFRKPCTWIIIVFVVFNLFHLKKLQFSKKSIVVGLLIASPFLIEVLLFGNNDSSAEGLKSLEKSLTLLFFPLFILGNYKKVDAFKTLKTYCFLTTATILFFFIRFLVVYPQHVQKYLNGIDLWEMGYLFANTIGIHATALNMHLAFAAIASLYFLIPMFSRMQNPVFIVGSIINFILSFFFVLFVNTRMAFLIMLLGFVVVFLYEIGKKHNVKKILKVFALVAILSLTVFVVFVQKYTFMKEKYSTQMFAHIDKIGKLDEIDHPEIAVYSSLVTRLSIWKSAWELSVKNLPFGVGASDGKPELFQYYRDTHQIFLATYQFPTHNQYLDFLLKFGILGVVAVFIYIFTIGYLGYSTKNAVIFSFFLLFFISNLTDDFLIRFDGIAYSGLWISIFGAYWLQQKTKELPNQ